MKVLCSLLVITQTARGFIKTAGVRAPLQLNTATIDAPVTPTPSIFVDTDKLLAESSFPLSSDEMIDLSKTFLLSRGGLGADPELLASSFQFEGPVVGPLSKDAFTKALGSVDFDAAFPDFQGEFYGFHVDPFEGNRVWYTARGKGTNTGPLPPFAPVATGKKLVNPPQVCSLTFDASGLVTKYTIGYVVDRTIGTTGGLGGLYGVLYAIGRPLPFPEAQPWKKSPQYALFQAVGGALQALLG
mmetsp:Transcript_7447/g.23432  ORF Transcript_7447/g.23432 Transcript_7447/m.23432 type:complete len:243 (-) Transcript_7447:24-752(-)